MYFRAPSFLCRLQPICLTIRTNTHYSITPTYHLTLNVILTCNSLTFLSLLDILCRLSCVYIFRLLNVNTFYSCIRTNVNSIQDHFQSYFVKILQIHSLLLNYSLMCTFVVFSIFVTTVENLPSIFAILNRQGSKFYWRTNLKLYIVFKHTLDPKQTFSI